jgi:hypothetical protein
MLSGADQANDGNTQHKATQRRSKNEGKTSCRSACSFKWISVLAKPLGVKAQVHSGHESEPGPPRDYRQSSTGQWRWDGRKNRNAID